MGNRRRDLLSRASSGDWVAVTLPDQSASTNDALSRAARALVSLGLAETAPAATAIARAECRGDHAEARRVEWYCIRNDIGGGRSLIRLTKLGRAIVRFFRRALEAGRAIRWERFFAAVERGQVVIA